MNRTVSRLITALLILIIFVFSILSLKHLLKQGEKKKITVSIEKLPEEPLENKREKHILQNKTMLLSASGFSRLFPLEYEPVPREDNVPEETHEPGKYQQSRYISFVGTMTESNGRENFYFKNEKSGRVVKLALGETVSNWNLSEVNNKSFILKIEESYYEISR